MIQELDAFFKLKLMIQGNFIAKKIEDAAVEVGKVVRSARFINIAFLFSMFGGIDLERTSVISIGGSLPFFFFAPSKVKNLKAKMLIGLLGGYNKKKRKQRLGPYQLYN